MRLPREIIATILGFCVAAPFHTVLANTEIVNFETSFGPDILRAEGSNWTVLHAANSQALMRVLPAPLDTAITTVCEPISASTLGNCPHEAWIVVESDDDAWSSYSKFTLRISWPAPYPTAFFIDLYSPEDLDAILHGTQGTHPHNLPDTPRTRRKFARIRLLNEGVFTPSPANKNRTIEPVPFIVAVEPLLLGVLPSSLLPTVLFLLAIGGVAGFVVLPRIQRHLFVVAEQVRDEHAEAVERRKQ